MIKKVIILFLSILACILSGSKAAIISMGILLFIIVTSREKKSIYSYLMLFTLIIGLCVMVWLFLYGNISIITDNTRLLFIRNRIIGMNTENDSSLGTGRGYDRIYEMGNNLLWGIGEGAYNRFITMRGKEIHSTYATLFVSYGVIGFLSYALVFKLCLGKKRIFIKNLLYISGVALYAITHNGLRNTLLWILLAIILTMNKMTGISDECIIIENDK